MLERLPLLGGLASWPPPPGVDPWSVEMPKDAGLTELATLVRRAVELTRPGRAR